MGKQILEDIQMDKALNYPDDRIAFYTEWNTARADRRNIISYLKGDLSLKELCQKTAKNNYLPIVTKEQMLNELRITKWIKD